MKLPIIPMFIVLTQNTFGFNFNNLNNMFNALKDTEPKVQKAGEHCCNPTAEEREQINQCVIDLCGYSGEVNSAYISDQDYEDYYKDAETFKDYEKFKPKLKKYLDTIRASTKKEIETIKANSTGSIPNYFNYDSYSDKQISSIVFDELRSEIHVQIIKDEDGNKKIKVSVKPSDVKFDEELKSKFIEFRINEIKTDFSSGIYSGYLELDKAMIFLKGALKKHLEEIDKKIALIPPENTLKIEQLNQDKAQYEEIKNSLDEIKEPTKGSVVDLFYSIQMINDTLTTKLNLKYFNVTLKDFECRKLKCKEYLSRKVPLIMSVSNLEEIIKQTEDNNKADALIKDCEYLWHQDQLIKAKSGKKEEFVQSIPQIVKRVEENFTSKFSEESSKSLAKYFKSLKYVATDDPIPGRDDFNQLQNLKQQVLKVIDPKEEDENNSYETDLKGVLADYKKIKNHFLMGEVRFEHALTTCEEADVIASDYFKPSKHDQETYIYISSFSCNHYTTGKQVLAHELGHAISVQFINNKSSDTSLKKYKSHRRCISNSYKDKTFAEKSTYVDFSFKEDTKYTEEDMADFVAGIVYGNPNETLLGCSLIAKDKNNIDYNREKLSVLNPISYDTHSSPFLRTLKDAISKNRILTPSCRKIIDKYKDKINFNKCDF